MSRYLASVPCGRPTFNGCMIAVVLIAAQSFGPPPAAPPHELGTAMPRWTGPHHSTPSQRWEIHGQGAAQEAVADDTM